MTKVALQEAPTRLAELVEKAARGEAVVITSDDGTTVRIVAAPQSVKKRGGYGSAKGQIWMADDFDEPIEDFDVDVK
ncbi:MAG: DUF2281 domain-containing protein [Deinococcota bacterium]|nr:DUF2281 domain-containing protein [Deinococcota bacterium]